MTTNDDLRRLAEAALAEEVALDADERARVEAESDDIHSGMNDWHDFDDIPPAHMAWYSAASPSVVLALLDEIASLRGDALIDATTQAEASEVTDEEPRPLGEHALSMVVGVRVGPIAPRHGLELGSTAMCDRSGPSPGVLRGHGTIVETRDRVLDWTTEPDLGGYAMYRACLVQADDGVLGWAGAGAIVRVGTTP
jgi:hypothetical protein